MGISSLVEDRKSNMTGPLIPRITMAMAVAMGALRDDHDTGGSGDQRFSTSGTIVNVSGPKTLCAAPVPLASMY